MYYNISKKQYKGDVLFFDYDNIKGYKVTPKNKIKHGILVTNLTVVKKEFITKILKKKVRIMLEILDSDSDDDTRKALDDIARYKKVINEKYSKYLDKKYISLLSQKINILEREFKNNLKIENEMRKKEFELIRQYEMQDEIEEKENRRKR